MLALYAQNIKKYYGDRLIIDLEELEVSNEDCIGYFSQQLDILDDSKTILDNVMTSSVQKESVVRTVLARLLFRREDVFKKVSVLSGSEKVKVVLAKLITSDANFLILDGPTNYLDLTSMEAMQKLLKEYEETLLLVSP